MKRKLAIVVIALVSALMVPTWGAVAKKSRTTRKSTRTTRVKKSKPKAETVDSILPTDNRKFTVTSDGDTIDLAVAPEARRGRLTEEDFREVAEELGVEVAAIKAVVEIEAGKSHTGFWKEGKPLIYFDVTMFRRMAARNGVNLRKYTSSHSVAFSRPNAARYGSRLAAQQARLDAARKIHNLSAIQGTFWGMFQIGGFNWNKCGTGSAQEFVELMSRSERDQLELFANFITKAGMVDALRARNWRKFASAYNGPGYAGRGYHTRMAAAYARYKKAEAQGLAEEAEEAAEVRDGGAAKAAEQLPEEALNSPLSEEIEAEKSLEEQEEKTPVPPAIAEPKKPVHQERARTKMPRRSTKAKKKAANKANAKK